MRRVLARVCLLAFVAAAAVVPAGAHETSSGTPHWDAEPAWIANTGVYRGGEFVYQDYVYDDHGANTDGVNRRDLPFGLWPDPQNPKDQRWSPTGGSVRHTGDFMYAAEDDHMANVADLLEFRVAEGEDDIFYRVRLGDMDASHQAAVGICVDQDRDRSTGLMEYPHGLTLQINLGCEQFITAWNGGWTIATTTQEPGAVGDIFEVNHAEATIDIGVPTSLGDPEGQTWRYTVFSGLFDGTEWAQPTFGPQVIGASVPTGGHPVAPPLWDLLSNNGEPNSYWMEERQANDLFRHLLADHYVDVSFGRVAFSRFFSDPAPARTGFVPRIYRSKHTLTPARGIDIDRGAGTIFIYWGRFQPYAMVVPHDYYRRGARPTPFDQCLHPLNGNHMVEVYYAEAFGREGYNPLVTGTVSNTGYLGFEQIEGIVDRLGTLYACVLGRGEGVGYIGGDGMADAQEVAADVERHYNVDEDRRTLHGVSLGAMGTWHIARQTPDRFSAIMPTIFSPAIVNSGFPQFENLYNVPSFFAIGTADEFAQGTQGDPTADALEAHGNEYMYLHYLGRQHEGRIHGDFQPFTEALAFTRERVENPARVRYTFDPAEFSSLEPGDGSAYWVSDMTPRATGSAAIDATSLARADELPTEQVVFDGLSTNTIEGWQARFRGLLRMSKAEFEAFWHPERWERGWEELSMEVTETALPVPAVSDGFTFTARNLAAVTLHARRMALDTDEQITGTLTGDGETVLTLRGSFAAGTPVTFDGAPVQATITGSGLTVTLPLTAGGHTLTIG